MNNKNNIQLSQEFEDIIELVAKEVHDMWAKQRIEQGWVYGEQRNDELKTHPCLVPYEQLPEIEKNYDRNTALTTLQALVNLGYTIQK